MTASDLSPAERMLIEQRCERLIRRYALLVDACDYDELAELFAENASFARPTDPANPIHGRDAIIAGFRKRPTDRITRHLVTNCVVTAQGPNSASAMSYTVVYQGPAEAESGLPATDKPAFIGGFEDTFVRESGVWKFASRQGGVALQTG